MAVDKSQPVDITGAMVEGPIPLADWLVILPVAVPLMAGAALLMARRNIAIQALVANLTLAVTLGLCVGLVLHVDANGPVAMTMGRWLPPFGISFTGDLTGAVLAAAGSFVALACGIYSVAESGPQLRRYGFYTFFLLMVSGVNGAFLTGDMFNLYVWFEVLLIASFGLIVLGSEPRQLDGALKYSFLNLVGTTFFLMATGVLYGAFGTLNMADITRLAPSLPESAPVVTIAALYLMAFAMKAAAFPLNFWLPASYHTPNIVVSALFAGLLTKVGIYAMLRVTVMIFAAERGVLEGWIAAVGAATMLVGVAGALAQSELRRMLGYLVISGIGTMMAGIAIAGEYGLSGAITYAVHSMVVMALLYLCVGVIVAKTGTAQLRDLGGLYTATPAFATAFLVGAIAMAGLPPFSGFWPKLLVVKAAIFAGSEWLAAIVLIAALLTSLAIMRVWLHAFWRGGPEGTRDGAEAWKFEPLPPDLARWGGLSIGMLLVAVILLGIAPSWMVQLAAIAARGLGNPDGYVQSVFGGGE